MSVKRLHDPDQHMFVFSIRNDKWLVRRAPSEVMDDLDTALTMLRLSLREEAYFRTFDLAGTWRPGGEEFDPTSEKNRAAWNRLATQPELKPRLRAWLSRAKTVMAEYEAITRDTIWESEHIQFGEEVASLMSALYVDFVPDFASMLQYWDIGHEVQTGETIDLLLEKYGICPETEELLIARTVHGTESLVEHMFAELDEHYGGFVHSDLFRRIVTAMHAKYEAYLRKHPSRGRDERWIFLNSKNKALTEAANVILAELDARLGSLETPV